MIIIIFYQVLFLQDKVMDQFVIYGSSYLKVHESIHDAVTKLQCQELAQNIDEVNMCKYYTYRG